MKLWIIPLAGEGKRVKKFGKCKPLIKINGHYILQWFLKGLKTKIKNDDIILFITNHFQNNSFLLNSKINKIVKKNLKLKSRIIIKTIPYTPLGPAMSVFQGIKELDLKCESIIANHDQFIDFELPSQKCDAFMPIYYNDNPSSSYVNFTRKKITKISEKKMISNYASSGIYGFKTLSLLKQILIKSLKNKPHFNGEYFIGPCMNNLIKMNKIILPVKTIFKFELGSVKGILSFKRNLIKFKNSFY